MGLGKNIHTYSAEKKIKEEPVSSFLCLTNRSLKFLDWVPVVVFVIFSLRLVLSCRSKFLNDKQHEYICSMLQVNSETLALLISFNSIIQCPDCHLNINWTTSHDFVAQRLNIYPSVHSLKSLIYYNIY